MLLFKFSLLQITHRSPFNLWLLVISYFIAPCKVQGYAKTPQNEGVPEELSFVRHGPPCPASPNEDWPHSAANVTRYLAFLVLDSAKLSAQIWIADKHRQPQFH
jgi:hypothetical protein